VGGNGGGGDLYSASGGVAIFWLISLLQQDVLSFPLHICLTAAEMKSPSSINNNLYQNSIGNAVVVAYHEIFYPANILPCID
jgi:hypothetical protein